jgi:hypothetical protein
MRVLVSAAAAELVMTDGGQVWVWAARPRMCCAGAPALMRAATSPPDGISGFVAVPPAATPGGISVYFRPSGGTQPDVLEIALEGRRRPRVAAYWDGCLMAMVS